MKHTLHKALVYLTKNLGKFAYMLPTAPNQTFLYTRSSQIAFLYTIHLGRLNINQFQWDFYKHDSIRKWIGRTSISPDISVGSGWHQCHFLLVVIPIHLGLCEQWTVPLHGGGIAYSWYRLGSSMATGRFPCQVGLCWRDRLNLSKSHTWVGLLPKGWWTKPSATTAAYWLQLYPIHVTAKRA